ncbi:MAG: ROK family transcriptional regulator [Pseudomonadota bacterium]
MSDTAALRSNNAALVLTEIRRRGETSRVDIAAALGLSAATVTAIVTDLLAQGLVRETDTVAASGRGRPRRQITLNPTARFVAGAKLNRASITVAILDFSGDVLADVEAPLPEGQIGHDILVDTLKNAFAEALGGAGLDARDIVGFGMGVPGFVERETGLCHWSPILQGTPVNVREMLEREIPCPVAVDNDANLATLAELWFGHGRDHRDFLVVTVEHGVGLGVVIDGRLYRGACGLGAEFGHTKVQIDGALCRCGQRGCLEAYVADFALAREAVTALSAQDLPTDTGALIDLLADRARAGDLAPAAIFRRAGRMLGLGLANLVNLFDPSLIVLTGGWMHNHNLMMEGVTRSVEENSLRTGRERVRIETHRWGDGLWARGAGALALEAIDVPGREAVAS